MFKIKFICYLYMPIMFGLFIISCENKEAKKVEPVVSVKDTIEKSQQIEDYLVLLVDDFDNGKKPNVLGGDFGAWNSSLNDYTQGCIDSFDSQNARGGLGYCLRLDYDVDSPKPAYNGFWTNLSDSDLNDANQLVFYVKGSETKGFTTKFKVELKNTKGEVGSYIVTGVTGVWQRIVIPFNKFEAIKDWHDMKELVIVFDDINTTQKTGTIFIDDIYFSREKQVN